MEGVDGNLLMRMLGVRTACGRFMVGFVDTRLRLVCRDGEEIVVVVVVGFPVLVVVVVVVVEPPAGRGAVAEPAGERCLSLACGTVRPPRPYPSTGGKGSI